MPGSSTPAGPHAPITMTVQRRGPRLGNDEGSHIGTFEVQSPGLEAGCLRFAGWVAPPPRKTRFQVLVALSWAGLITRRVSMKGFELLPTSQPPFPSLLGTIPVSFFSFPLFFSRRKSRLSRRGSFAEAFQRRFGILRHAGFG